MNTRLLRQRVLLLGTLDLTAIFTWLIAVVLTSNSKKGSGFAPQYDRTTPTLIIHVYFLIYSPFCLEPWTTYFQSSPFLCLSCEFTNSTTLTDYDLDPRDGIFFLVVDLMTRLATFVGLFD